MKYFFWLYWTFLSFFNCVADKHPEVSSPGVNFPKKYISFEVDSFIRYPLDSFYISSFCFSPVMDQDHLWLFGMGKIYDVDLLRKEKTLLEKKYPGLSLTNVGPQEIWKDTFRGEIFFTPFHGTKSVVFNPKEGTMHEFQIQGITTCINSNDSLIVGTARGLFVIDKKTWKVQPMTGVPLDLWINQLEILENELLINNTSYSLEIKLEKPLPWTRPDLPNHHEAWELVRTLPEDRRLNYFPLGGDDFYLYSSAERQFYSDSDHEFYEIDFLPKEKINALLEDDQNWYLMYPHQILIVNRQFALEKARPYDLITDTHNREACRKKLNELQRLPLKEFIQQAPLMYADSSCYPLDDAESLMSETFYYYLSYAIFNNTEEVKKAFADHQFPPALEKYVIIALIKYYMHSFDTQKTTVFIDQLATRYPEFEIDNSKSILSCYKAIIHSVDSLKALKLARDEYLFKEATIKERLVQCGWFGDNYYDFSLRENNYQQILKEFPDSPYAEEIESYYAGSEDRDVETGYPETMAGLKSLDRFLRKYPNSRFEGEIQLEKAEIMSLYNGETDSMVWYKEEAIKIIKAIKPKFLLDTIFARAVESQLFILENDLRKITFDFTISVSDQDISGNETMILTAKLANRCGMPRHVRIFSSSPFFSVDIYPDLSATFIPGINGADTSTKEIIMQPGEFIEDKMRIPGRIRKLIYTSGTQFGELALQQDGYYYFTAYGPDYRFFSSNQVGVFYHK